MRGDFRAAGDFREVIFAGSKGDFHPKKKRQELGKSPLENLNLGSNILFWVIFYFLRAPACAGAHAHTCARMGKRKSPPGSFEPNRKSPAGSKRTLKITLRKSPRPLGDENELARMAF